jgi:hypothetical protein
VGLTILFYRGGGHSTTTIKGQYRRDPDGNHFTFCYKDEQQYQAGTHIACHGYTPHPKDYALKKATFSNEKPDSTLKSNNKPVWPAENELDVVPDMPEIGYQH